VRAPARPSVRFAAPPLDERDVEAVVAVLRRGWITTGEETEAFEAELAAATGARHVVAMSSCTAALETAFAHLHLPPGSVVGVPTWTFVSSALAPLKHGCDVLLLDVDEDTLNVDAEAVERGLDAGMAALLAVHFGGVPVAREVLDLAAHAGVPVVEDAAHALGAADHRGPIAGRGTAGACFSFYATKNLTTAEGGALATDDPDLAAFARSYRLHGLDADAWARYRPGARASYDLVSGGIKANLPDLLAALGRSQLRRFGELQARRRAAVRRYRAGLAGVPGLRFVPAEVAAGGADHLAVVLLPEGTDRDRVVAAMADAGIGTSVHFQPLHRFGWLGERARLDPGGTPVADAAAGRALSLPLHPSLADDDVDRVCEELARCL
jgi:dTDP-4-amino-4,6-dideoxygalactose transaminase